MRLWQKIFLPTLALMVLLTTLIAVGLLKTSRDLLWQREGQRAVSQQQYLAGMLRAGVASQRLQRGLIQLSGSETDRAARQVLAQQAEGDYLRGIALYNEGGKTLFDHLPEGPDGPLVPPVPGGGAAADAEGAESTAAAPGAQSEPAAQSQSAPGDELGVSGSLGEPGAGRAAAAQPGPDSESDATLTVLCRGGQDRWYLLCSMPVRLEGGQYRLCAGYDVSDLQSQLNRQAAGTVALCLALSLLGAGALLVLVRRLLRPLTALDVSARRIAAGSYAERLSTAGNDELAGLAADMNQLASAVQRRIDQLEQLAEERKAFIGNLAHEMKTPLTSILGFADLLYLPSQVPDDKRVEYACVIAEEAKRLRALSGKLLELMTLGSANLVFEPVSLRELADEVALSLRPVLAQSGLQLACDCPDTPLWVDRELFKSLLYNLLDNGRKASEAGGMLRLAARPEGGRMTILVRDYGRGIPQEELDKICRPFYMVDKSRSRKAGGAGLGLALCQEIVAVHRGKMEIDSRVGKGTLIAMRFPLEPPPEQPGQNAAKPPQAGTPPHARPGRTGGEQDAGQAKP